MCSDAGSELAPIMVLHERQRSEPVGSVGHVSPPKLALAVNDCAHAFAAAELAKLDGLPVSKLEYVPISLLVDMKQSLCRPMFAVTFRSITSFANTGRRSSRSCWM